MTLIEIKETHLRKLIQETIVSELTESISPIVWHFTDFEAASAILQTNSFRLSQSNVDRDKLPGVTGYSEKRNYYMCMTRSKNSNEGYSKMFSDKDNHDGFVRFQINGSALNNIAHGKASDYFGSRDDKMMMGKRALYRGIERGLSDKTIQQRYQQKYNSIQDNEKEDTVWYNKPTISNANRYISRIDVFIATEQSFKENYGVFQTLQSRAQKLNIPIYFYGNLKDIDLQTNRTVTIKSTQNA